MQNLRTIVQQEVNEQTPATSTAQMEAQFKTAWGRIKPSVLESLVAGMPQRMRGCVAMEGGCIGK